MISGEQLREEKKGKVPVSFPTWCLAAPMQKVLSGASVGILPFRSTLMRTLTLMGAQEASPTLLLLLVQTCS